MAQGEKAASNDLGLMGDVGIVAETAHMTKGKEEIGGLAQIFESEFLALLDQYRGPDPAKEPTLCMQPIIGLLTPAQLRKRGIEPPAWLLERPMLKGLERLDRAAGDTGEPGEISGGRTESDWTAQFLRAGSSAEALLS
ncbi:hypothetical protein F5Y18DRAFT_432376 [Xylariaceae sp. FL1019]|nr:hypothetical protein F5Y18DRAFT_432376 [Xylariaceae sp. FL1019]